MIKKIKEFFSKKNQTYISYTFVDDKVHCKINVVKGEEAKFATVLFDLNRGVYLENTLKLLMSVPDRYGSNKLVFDTIMSLINFNNADLDTPIITPTSVFGNK